ncbi:hypothetical protein EGW08_000822, partial [Elysia chlorotica]
MGAGAGCSERLTKMRELRGNFVGQETTIDIKQTEVSTTLQPDEILVKIHACAVDLAKEKVFHQLLSNSLENRSIGHVISGVVVKTGSNVEKYKEDMCFVG